MINATDWNIIPVGDSAETGETLTYNVKFAPHTINIGSMGTGSSIVNRTIFSHLLQHSDKWEYIGIDPMNLWLQYYKKYTRLVSKITSDAEDIYNTIKEYHTIHITRISTNRRVKDKMIIRDIKL